MSAVPQGDETRIQAEAFAAALEVGSASPSEVCLMIMNCLVR